MAKQIDKETMFKKIMPSGYKSSAALPKSSIEDSWDDFPAPIFPSAASSPAEPAIPSPPPAKPAILPDPSPAQAPVPTSPQTTASGPAAEPSPSPQPEQPPAKPLDPMLLRAHTQGEEGREYVLVNIIEQLVEQKVKDMLPRFKCCQCPLCQQDVAAVALNRLTPQYQVLELLGPQPIPSQQDVSSVTAAVVQAIVAVKAHPRHP